MRLIDRLRTPTARQEQRAGLLELFETWGGAQPKEKIEDDFPSYVQQGYKANGIIFAVIQTRISLFSGAKFVYRDRRTKQIIGDTNHPALRLLQFPWENATTGELLAKMEQHVSLAGNAYVYRADPSTLELLRPDWMEIVSDGRQIIGYAYTVGGKSSLNKTVFLLPEEVAHWSPIPDPMANYRGVSWMSSVLTEIQSDVAMTRHKQMFHERAATPNMLIKFQDKLDVESRERLRNELNLRHEGLDNAYRTLVLDGGADAINIGKGMGEIDFTAVQSAGENRIASAAGVPGIVAGLKEGLQAATYSNFEQAMRRWVDLFGYPQWQSVCACLSKFVNVPGGAELWYDVTDIPALRQSEMQRAEITLAKSTAMVNLIRAGYEGEAVALAVDTGEGIGELPHTGLVYFPGAQAYTSPGQEPPTDSTDTAVPGAKGTPALGNGQKALPPGRSMRFVRDENGLLKELVAVSDEASADGAE